MNISKALTTTIALALTPLASAQAPVGDTLPDTLGFSFAQPSAPLQNISEFDLNDREGEVIVVVYHVPW